MPAPPNLDDRRFQDLVDDAKRLRPAALPRVDRPQRLRPGRHAHRDVRLHDRPAPLPAQPRARPQLREVPRAASGSACSRRRPPGPRHVLAVGAAADADDDRRRHAGGDACAPRPTTRSCSRRPTDLAIDPVELAIAALADRRQDAARPHGAPLERGHRGFFCFAQAADARRRAATSGSREAVPSCAVRLRFQCRHRRRAASTRPTRRSSGRRGRATAGSPCELDADATGGLNRDGDVVIHVPAQPRAVADLEAARRLAARRVTEPVEGQPAYSASPKIRASRRSRSAARSRPCNAELVDRRGARRSPRACPASGSCCKRGPSSPATQPAVLEVSGRRRLGGVDRGRDFAASGPTTGTSCSTPLVGRGPVRAGGARWPTARCARYGAVPAKGAHRPPARVPHRRRPRGQRAARRDHACSSRRSRSWRASRTGGPARGGVDGEDIENAKLRGPIRLRTRDRAVTAEDYEQLAREAAPEVARVRAVAAGDGTDAGSVRVLIVPSAVAEHGRLRFDQLVPDPDTLQKVTDRLEERRIIGTRAIVEPPVYRGDHGGGPARRGPASSPTRAPGGRAARAVRVLPPDHGRPGRHRLAVRPADQRGRGLLGAAGDPRARSSSRTCGCSAPTR